MSATGQVSFRFLSLEVPRGAGFPRHRHAEHQLLSVEGGAMAVATASDQWAVPARSGVWLASGLDHELTAVDDAHVVFAYLAPGPAWPAPDRPAPATGVVTIRPLLREALGALAHPGGVVGARRDRLESVLLDELGDLSPEPFHLRLPTDPSARGVAERLLADPALASSLEELGREAGASGRTLQRRFRAQSGLTFQQWRRRARVQCAMGELADGETVTAVAHRCGFASASAFVAAFRAETGTTPTSWRRRLATPGR